MSALASMFAGIMAAIAGLFGMNDLESNIPQVTLDESEVYVPGQPNTLPAPSSEGGALSQVSAPTPDPVISSGYSAPTADISETVIEAENQNVKIYTFGNYRYIESTGLPNHNTGDFPNNGNPNVISEQSISVKVPIQPTYTGAQTPVQIPGIALNGILMEPGTAEREGNYNIEALQETYNLGLDYSNAHVQPTGLYHYHGVPEGYLETVYTDKDLIQVGWAADGFPMYHSQSHQYQSGWELVGTRSDGSEADGTYTQDFTFSNGGNLDQCNGAWLDADTYAYFITDEFPYIPRCLNGTPDDTFSKEGGGGHPASQTRGAPPNQDIINTGAPPNGIPPTEAVHACDDEIVGALCNFEAPHGAANGVCQDTPGGLSCVPTGAPQPI